MTREYYLDIDNIYVDIIHNDNLNHLKKMKSNSVHSIVTDPPYEINFMHKEWDNQARAHDKELWKECLRVLKPGGFLLAFSATRTYHRLAIAIEDAGFTIKDQICWIYGQGMPHGLNISKAIEALEKTGGSSPKNLRKLDMGKNYGAGRMSRGADTDRDYKNTPKITNKQAKQWDGWNTLLKPAVEPIVMAQKPISEKTIVKNILKWGTGAINIDASRIAITKYDDPRLGGKGSWGTSKTAKNVYAGGYKGKEISSSAKGKYPANVIHDGHKDVVSLFPHSKSGAMSTNMTRKSTNKVYGKNLSKTGDTITAENVEASEGSAARFFYCAKANKQDRAGSKHVTVKPIKLMRYLVRLVTPPQGIVLDLFAGTGTTGYAAYLEGFDSVMIEQSKEYIGDIKNRFRPLLKNKES